jgi:hypothetical protein
MPSLQDGEKPALTKLKPSKQTNVQNMYIHHGVVGEESGSSDLCALMCLHVCKGSGPATPDISATFLCGLCLKTTALHTSTGAQPYWQQQAWLVSKPERLLIVPATPESRAARY